MKKAVTHFTSLTLLLLTAVMLSSCGPKGPKGEILTLLEEAQGVMDEMEKMIDNSASYQELLDKMNEAEDLGDKLNNLKAEYGKLMEKHEAELTEEDIKEIEEFEKKLDEQMDRIQEKVEDLEGA